jgi:murein DD-endopeptidase MepM/ murein hydrolase activator NlpD
MNGLLLALIAAVVLTLGSVVGVTAFIAGAAAGPAIMAARSASAAQGAVAPSAQAIADIPADALRNYQDAAKICPGLDWTVLAGIGKEESDHGRSQLRGVSSGSNTAGGMGPMQFLQSSWDAWLQWAGQHGLGALSNVYDLRSAAFAAARYLCAAGAPGNLRQAIFAYNHATWYVDDVLRYAAQYKADATQAAAGVAQGAGSAAQGPVSAVARAGDPFAGACQPVLTQGFGPTNLLLEPALHGFAHFHTGKDLSCPAGTPVHSVTAGVAHVTQGCRAGEQACGGGYGNHVYIEVQVQLPGDAGPQRYFVLYAHLDPASAADGATVQAGSVLGLEGSTGASTGAHLHFELDRGAAGAANAVDPSPLLAVG